MPISAPLRAGPFYTGSSSTASTLVPYHKHVALDGHAYMLDTAMADQWGHETVPLLRAQSDDSTEPGQQSINPDGLWRRSWDTWHKGAGQTHRDRSDSNPARFSASYGLDPWTRYELSLLPAVDQKHTSSNTNLKLVVAGDRLFLMDGSAVTYTEDITVDSPTWDTTSGEPAGPLLDIASDGENIYITDGSDVYDAVASDTPPDFTTAWSTQDVDTLAFVKGRLVGGHDNKLYTFAADGTATEIVTTATVLPSTFEWVGFAGGPSNSVIYAAGFAGDKSLIVRIGIEEDGSGLDVAIPAGELPDGEIVRAIGSYLGFVLIGTDEGVRFATPDSTGNLTIGALLDVDSPVRCFEGQGPFVWFGWDSFTEIIFGLTTCGLGRLSLEEFSAADKLAPAYATDMRAVATGVCSSVVTFQEVRVWTMEGTNLGVYAEETDPGASGYLFTGLTDFGFSGEKFAHEIELAVNIPEDSSVSALVAEDGSSTTSAVGTITGPRAGVISFDVDDLAGSRFTLLLLITNTASATSPTITSATLKVLPGAADATRKIVLPILLHEYLDPDGGVDYMDVNEELNRFEGWWNTRQPISLNELGRSYTVTVEDFRWIPRLRETHEGFGVDGTIVVTCKEV